MVDIQTMIDIINEDESEDEQIIFIRNGSIRGNGYVNVKDLDILAELLDTLKKPVKLITTDGDRPVPSSYNLITIKKILSSNKILKWYSQNYDKIINHPKLTYMPIGFDLHSQHLVRSISNNINEGIQSLVELRRQSPIENRIKHNIFCDAHLSITHIERKYMFKLLRKNKHIDFTFNKVSFFENAKKYNQYRFVLSPRGNGVDCHRTWELFLAGVIVITKTSSLDEMFIKHELPVVILKDWEQLNVEKIEEQLDTWYNEHKHKTDLEHIMPRLTFSYWLNN
jgi:hypothetical protein